jgi:hypothetical protein
MCRNIFKKPLVNYNPMQSRFYEIICRKKVLVLFMFVFSCMFSYAQGKTIYVDCKNPQTGNGELSNPFKSIQPAFDSAAEGDSILVRAGVYREQLTLTKSKLTFAPYNNEKVTINGCDLLLTWNNTKGTVYKSIMNWNITQSDQSNQIFCDGKMLDLTRWPANTASILLPSNGFADNVTTDGTNNIIADADFQEPAGKWDGCEIWVNISRSITGDGWDGQGWTGKVISSSPGKIIVQGKITTVLGNFPYGLGPNTEYFLFNPSASSVKLSGGIENYIKPGEWWKNGDTLFVNTPSGEAPSLTSEGANIIEAKKRLYSFAFSNQNNIVIRDFNTFGCAINTDLAGFFNRTSSVCGSSDIIIYGIKAEYVTHFTNQAKNWQMQWVQRSGFIISGTNITLQNSEIHYSAGSGVSVFGRANKILNNKIWDVNYSSSECGAVNTGLQYDPSLVISEDHEIAYNTIFNTPQQGINIRALVNSSKTKPGMARIHHNIIHDFMLKTHDSGGIDTYNTDGGWVRIDHNIIYNSTLMLAIGFYLDFGTNYIVDHNLFYNVERPVQLNEGGWDPNPSQYSDVWVYNNTALADKTNKAGILNAAGPFPTGFKVLNNLTTAELKSNLAAPLVKNNFTVNSTATLAKYFTNTTNQDYTLNTILSPAIDTCELQGPFNDLIINKPDAGCFESGIPAWKAGYGNMSPGFIISDNAFELKSSYLTPKTWKFPVFVLPYCGFSGSVNLVVNGLPDGISTVLSANSVEAGKSADLSISVAGTVLYGIYTFKLEGNSGEFSDTRYYTIEVRQEVTTIKIQNPVNQVIFNTYYQLNAIAMDQAGNPMAVKPLFTWTCSGGGSISSTGKYKASAFSNEVKVIVKSGNVKDSCTFSVGYNTSVEELNSDIQLPEIFPNPASNSFTMNKLPVNSDIEIFTVTGELVFNTKNLKQETIIINLDGYKKGIYIVNLKYETGSKKLRLIIQ